MYTGRLPEAKVADPKSPDWSCGTDMRGHVPVGLQPHLWLPVHGRHQALVLLQHYLWPLSPLPDKSTKLYQFPPVAMLTGAIGLLF